MRITTLVPNNKDGETSWGTIQVKQQQGLEEQESYYERLGLHPSVSVGEIRRVYHELSLQYHPDTTTLPIEIAKPIFQRLNEAYATLSHPERRLQYDREIGYSSISVVRTLPTLQQEAQQRANPNPRQKYDPSFSSYLDAEDRPLSSGELFALFILGVTWLGCIGLAVFLGRSA